MTPRLIFADARGATDALTFAGRAAPLGDGVIRLRADGGVLVMTSAPLAPATLLDATPTVLGVRIASVDPELVCDLVVTAAALSAGEGSDVVLPDSAVTAPWAGIAPPRGGWERAGTIGAAVLAQRAQWGIAAVAEALPASPGEDIVRTVRSQVWGEPDEALAGLPRGVAFAAHALGFIAGAEEAPVYRSGPWARVSLARGHVLTRTRVHTGLTDVRATGGG